MQGDQMGFHPKWVLPVYLQLMKGNFLWIDDQQREQLIVNMRRIISEITPFIVKEMLKSTNWRPRTTAGWLVGFGKMEGFTQLIGNNLIKYPYHADMNCFALARINDEESIDYLRQYLSEYLQTKYAKDMYSENLSVNYGIAALEIISDNTVRDYFPEKWQMYLDALVDYYSPIGSKDELYEMYGIDHAREYISKVMTFANEYFD